MKKILFILHLPPPVHGSSIMGQTIRESKIINREFNCRYINLSTSRTIDEIGKNPLAKVGRYLSILCRVLWQIGIFRPHVCYITPTAGGNGFYKDVPILILAGLTGARKLYHFHNKGVKSHQQKWLDDKLYRLVFRKAEVILLSKYLYNDIEKYVPESMVKYCANGVNPLLKNVFDLLPVAGEGHSEHATQNTLPEILFLSNLIESKGVYLLLEACKIIQDKGLLFHCTLVGGEGDITTELLNLKIAEMGLAEIVKYAGKQYGTEKELYWEKADIFTLPSFYHNECMPLVLLEAMQHSLPIVSTTEGAIPEIVIDSKTGFLVAKKDVTALAAKLEALIINHELCKSMGKEGLKHYEQNYTLRAFEARLEKTLNTIQ